MARVNGNDERPADDVEARRARARRNAVLLGLVAAGIFVGYLLLGWLVGIFPD